MKNHHLFYQNFISLIENRPKNVGWHWRGEAVIKQPQNLKKCPFPLRKIYKDLHAQLLQWHATPLLELEEDNISGEMYLLDIDTFDTPIQEITISILGKNRIGKLYDWIENEIFEEIDYEGVGVYIFVDNEDKNFCHLVLKNEYYIPTAFDIDDFLLLLAHTRGLQGLYSCLGRGIEGRFLDDLFTLKEIFDDVDIDFCIQKLYEQHIKFNPKTEITTQSTKIRVFIDETHLRLLLNSQEVEIEINPNYIFTLVQGLYKSLIYIEKPYSDDFFEYDFKAWQSQKSLFYNDVIFSISHSEKHLLVMEKIDLVNTENNFSDFCEAVSFYKALLICVNEFATKEKDIIKQKSLIWSAKKLQTILQFLYVENF